MYGLMYDTMLMLFKTMFMYGTMLMLFETMLMYDNLFMLFETMLMLFEYMCSLSICCLKLV